MRGMMQALVPVSPGIGALAARILNTTTAMNQAAAEGEPFVGSGGRDEPPTLEENGTAPIAALRKKRPRQLPRMPEGDKGKAFEKAVQDTFADKTVRRNKIIRDGEGNVLTEIDAEIDEALIQIGRSLDGKSEQLHMSAAIAKERGKMLFVIWGPAERPNADWRRCAGRSA